ncbi:MAG: lysylphosphatidylglycerol synthase domain-containing protein [Bacteroidota bacterium]
MQLRREDIRRWAPWTGKLLLAAALIALLIHTVQRDTLASLLLRANPFYIAAALLLLPLNLYFQFHKWGLLVRSRIPLATPQELRRSLLLGFTFGIVTPARLGEFGGRAAGIRTRSDATLQDTNAASRNTESRKDGPPVADKLALIGLTAIDKLATMVVTVLVGLFSLLLFCWRHPFMDPWLLSAILLLAIGAALIIYFRWNRRPVDGSTAPPPSAAANLNAASCASADPAAANKSYLRRRYDDVRSVLRDLDPARIQSLMLFSVLFYLTFLVQFFFLISAFGPIDTLSTVAGIGTIMLVKTVIPPVTIGELGIREGASVYVLGHAGILAAAALNASLLLFAVNVFLPSLAGLALLLRLPRREAAQ